MLLNGSHLVKASKTATDAFDVAEGNAVDFTRDAGGIVMDRPVRLEIGQYLEIGPVAGPAVFVGYVKSIDMDNKVVFFSTDKALTVAADLTVAGVIDGHRGFLRGAISGLETFVSLPDQLLSLANGGLAALFGVTKLSYPHLQALNIDGAGLITASDEVLAGVFSAYNETRQVGKGNPTAAMMSFKHLAGAMKELEQSRDYVTSDTKANRFGWTEIQITGVRGSLTFVGVPEMDDDKIYIIDWDSMQLHSNEFFERRTAPDGKQFFETRASTGYQYIVDTRFYGELVVNKPSHNGVIYNIPNY